MQGRPQRRLGYGQLRWSIRGSILEDRTMNHPLAEIGVYLAYETSQDALMFKHKVNGKTVCVSFADVEEFVNARLYGRRVAYQEYGAEELRTMTGNV